MSASSIFLHAISLSFRLLYACANYAFLNLPELSQIEIDSRSLSNLFAISLQNLESYGLQQIFYSNLFLYQNLSFPTSSINNKQVYGLMALIRNNYDAILGLILQQLNLVLKMSENLMECIRKIKQKYNKYGQFRNIVQQKASTTEEMEQKIRSMSIAFQIISEQNAEVMRLHSGLAPLLEEKDKIIQLKQVQIRKYRQQILDLANKNEQLSNYSRKLANQYTILLTSMKDSQQTSLNRQMSAYSKLKMMEQQVCFLRQNVLNKNQTPQTKQKDRKQQNFDSQNTKKRKKSLSKKKQKENTIKKSRKSIAYELK